jgi:outer membrane protein OmpA-like peptidoglycan-associated protein
MRTGRRLSAGEQGYLASVSDLMAVLFFIVMIILVVFAVKTIRDNERLEALEREKEEALAELRELNSNLQDARDVRAAFIAYIKEEMEKRGKTIVIDPNEGIFRLPESVLFPSGGYMLNKDGVEALTALGSILSGRLPCYSGLREPPAPPSECDDPAAFKPGRFDVILIEGHTDSVNLSASHRLDDNLQLSAFRSWTTYNFLKEKYPELTGLKNSDGQYLFGVSGYGETRKIASNDDEEGKSRNRRVDFRIVLAAPLLAKEPESSQ